MGWIYPSQALRLQLYSNLTLVHIGKSKIYDSEFKQRQMHFKANEWIS